VGPGQPRPPGFRPKVRGGIKSHLTSKMRLNTVRLKILVPRSAGVRDRFTLLQLSQTHPPALSQEATVYTQIDTDPVCRSNPPLAPTRRGTGVIFYWASRHRRQVKGVGKMLPVTCYSLLVTRYSLLVTRYSLLVTRYFGNSLSIRV
jgi:hypothetical protein